MSTLPSWDDLPPCETDPSESVESIPLACRHCGVPVDEIPEYALGRHNAGKCAEDERPIEVTFGTVMAATTAARRLSGIAVNRSHPNRPKPTAAELLTLAADLEALSALLKYEAVKS